MSGRSDDVSQPPAGGAFAPLAWWSAHAWLVAWAAVILTPAGVIVLRLVDDSGRANLVDLLRWLFVVLLALTLGAAGFFSTGQPAARRVLGLLAAIATVAVLLYPVTRVTLGYTACPARAGADLGVSTAAFVIEAWRRGDAGDIAWRRSTAEAGWRDKIKAVRLSSYQLVASGCFDRVAPIDTRQTWHDFRVTVKEGERPPLSKVVIVRTVAEGTGWKITGIEGPLP